MVLAFQYSTVLGICAGQETERMRAHFTTVGLPTQISDIPGDMPDAEGLLDLMAQDKKVERGKLTLILARAIGDAYVDKAVDDVRLRDFLKRASPRS